MSFAAGLILVALLAFAGRAAYVLLVTRHQDGPAALDAEPDGVRRSFDEVGYEIGARKLAEGEWFKVPVLGPPVDDATHPPMTRLLLAPVALVTDGDEGAMRLAVALAGTGVVVLVGLIGRHIGGPRVGLVAAGVAALYPNLWVNDGLVMSETFATLGTAAAVLFACRLRRRATWQNAMALGLAIAAAMLSRSELVLLVPLLLVPVALTAPGVRGRRRLALTGVALAAAGAAVAPWVAYNLSRFEEPVLLSHGDGDVLAGSNCDKTYEGSYLGYWYGPCGFLEEPHERSVEAARRRTRALRYAADHLERVPVVVAARIGRIWGVYRPIQMARLAQYEGRPLWVSLPGSAMFLPLAGLGVAGAVILRRRGSRLLPLLAPVAAVTLTAAASYGIVRFRAPAEVSIVVLAAVAVDAWWRRRDDHGERASKVDPRPEPLSQPDGDREDHPVGDAARRRATT